MLAFTPSDGSTGAIALAVLLLFITCAVLILKLSLDLKQKDSYMPREIEPSYHRQKQSNPVTQRQLYYIKEPQKNRSVSGLKPVSPKNLFVLSSVEDRENE